MRITYWIITGLASLAFLASGMNKLFTDREKILQNKMMSWANDFSAPQIKLIGLAEVLGAAGLTLPHALSIAENLSKVAGIALLLLMLGAVNTHRRRKEPIFPPLILGLLALASPFLW